MELDLIERLFDMDYKNRITAEQALEHEFFNEIRKIKTPKLKEYNRKEEKERKI